MTRWDSWTRPSGRTRASRSRSRAGLASTYAVARRNGIGFNLTYIDRGIPEVAAQQGFDTAYMRTLFDEGYAKARAGAVWESTLPRDTQVEVQAALQ